MVEVEGHIKPSVDAPETEVAIKVFIVDDHPIVRRGLVQLIDGAAGMTVCGQSDNATAALQAMLEVEPDVALVDLSLKDSSGLQLIKDLKDRAPRIVVVVVSMLDESFYAERALRAGARAYVPKDECDEKILDVIHRVLRGEICVSDRMATLLIRKHVAGNRSSGALPMERLTDREMEVFELIGSGLTTREIAARLHLSIKTIESHRGHIKEKLKLSDSNELLKHAIQWAQYDKRG